MAPTGQSCVFVCTPECVPGHTCYEGHKQELPLPYRPGICLLFTPSSKLLAGISEGLCPLKIGYA